MECRDAAEVHSRFIKELLKVIQDDLFGSGKDSSQPGYELIAKNMTHSWNFFKLQGGNMV